MSRYFTLALGPFWLALTIFAVTGSAHFAAAVGLLSAVTLFVLVEVRRRDDPLTWRDVRHDAVHAVLSAATAQVGLLASAAVIGWQERIAIDWPLMPQVLAIVVGADFLGYWAHRAQHRFTTLWAGHALHHTPRKLYWLNGLRAHPTDTAWVFAVATVWTLLAGFSLEAFLLASVIQTTYLIMQHTPLDFPRSLAHFFVTPAWHQVHHHEDEEQANLGHIFTVWDRMFGTYEKSPERAKPLGVEGVATNSLADELALPFRLNN